jgi:hypothetical protein
MKEIKKMTTLQVNLYLQRNQEPMYKRQIDYAVSEATKESKGKK